MIAVTAHVTRSLWLAVPIDAAWALLHDVPRWGALYPRVETVEPLPGHDDAFVWQLEALGPPGGRVRVTYACHYVADEAARALVWTPVEGIGTARFSGACLLTETDEGGTDGTLRMDATLQIPAPSFLRSVVEASVNAEMGRMTDTFLSRLGTALGV